MEHFIRQRAMPCPFRDCEVMVYPMNEILEALLRFAFEIVFRIVCSIPGWIAAHVFRLHGKVDVDGCFVLLCGLVFWGLIGCCLWLIAA